MQNKLVLVIDKHRALSSALGEAGVQYRRYQLTDNFKIPAQPIFSFVWIRLGLKPDASEASGNTSELILSLIKQLNVPYLIFALVEASEHLHHKDCDWRKDVIEQVASQSKNSEFQVTATFKRTINPLVYRCLSSCSLQLKKFVDVHRAYGRQGANVETHESMRRLSAGLLKCIQNAPVTPPAQARAAGQLFGEARPSKGEGPVVGTEADRPHCSGEVPLLNWSSDRATPESGPAVSSGHGCEARRLAQQSQARATQESLRLPDSKGINIDTQQTAVVGSRCSVVADTANEMDGSGPTVTLKISIGSVPAPPASEGN
jgi:hypothetical protein